MSPDDTISRLYDAIRLSPDNPPLRRHFADTLLSLGRSAEAEEQYMALIKSGITEPGVELSLAEAYFLQGKNSHALVIVEKVMVTSDRPAAAYILHARLLLRAGDQQGAARRYRLAIDQDPSLADAALEKELEPGPACEVEPLRERAAAHYPISSAECDLAAEKPTINFDDVGGMEAVKEEIRVKIIHPLAHPDLYAAYGKAVGGGILMYGPPGCGKTLLARATAGEVRASFLAVDINDVLEMWLGQSERNLHKLFDYARSHKPCVLFFDEVDALAARREDLKYSAGRHVINQFLAELDGVRSSNEGVLILAATNAPWHLDPAFRRPGRFDRILFVPPPDEPARKAIMSILLKGKPVRDIDHHAVALQTMEFSGADLAAVVDRAIEVKLREAVRTNTATPLTTTDLLAAAEATQPSTREWTAMARNYAIYANQSGTYDDVVRYLKLT